MLSTKLLLIEGLPGSGKTSLAKYLTEKLAQNSITADCFLEDSSAHPTLAPWDDDPETFLRSSVATWRGFSKQAAFSERTTIIEGNFFQSTPRLLLQQNLEPTRIQAYIQQVEGFISDLDPVLMYLHPLDIGFVIEEICVQRGAEWRRYFVQAVTENRYGQHKHLTGMEGAIAFMQTYQNLCDNMFKSLAMKKVKIDFQTPDWERIYQEITIFLEL
jgi:deoxyadenosine/deoxycytidine kinase